MTRSAQSEASDTGTVAADSHMQMSDEQYFRSCVAKERQLAQLLGHQNIEECYESAGTLWAGAQALPRWTRDWHACGPLLAHYRLAIAYDAASAAEGQTSAAPSGHATHANHAGPAVRVGDTRILLANHPSRDRALMFAIVREVIRLLEHPRGARPAPAALTHPVSAPH